MKRIIFLLPLFLLCTAWLPEPANDVEKDKTFKAFENLIGKRWMINGRWNMGMGFTQECSFQYGLEKKLIRVLTYGTNYDEMNYGPRNEGIRFWDKEQKKMRFWEFDVFGNSSEGRVYVQGSNIYYEYFYPYENGTKLLVTDAWIYKDPDNYEFKMGVYKYGRWEKIFIEGTIKRVMDEQLEPISSE